MQNIFSASENTTNINISPFRDVNVIKSSMMLFISTTKKWIKFNLFKLSNYLNFIYSVVLLLFNSIHLKLIL